MLRTVEGIEVVHIAADNSKPEAIAHPLGAVPHDAVPGIAAACDLIVRLPEIESFGMPILEQFAAGGTAIATAYPGHEQLLHPGANCIAIDPAAPFAPAREALIALRDNPAHLASLRLAARATATHFDWPTLHHRFETFLHAPAAPAPQRLPIANAYRPCLAETIALWARDTARP